MSFNSKKAFDDGYWDRVKMPWKTVTIIILDGQFTRTDYKVEYDPEYESDYREGQAAAQQDRWDAWERERKARELLSVPLVSWKRNPWEV